MKPVELFAPPEYWKLTDDERRQFRCGPGRGILEKLVPDRILGVDVGPACGIHDFCYSQGRANQDKADADLIFLNNLIRLVETCGGYDWLQKMRLRFAHDYYEAVSHFGGPAFWKGKNKPEEMGVILLGAYRHSDGFV